MGLRANTQPASSPCPGRVRLLASRLLVAVLCAVLFLVLVEGVCSLAFVARGLVGPDAVQVAERKHTVYDPLLGWVNQPDLVLPDMYGPGIALTIGPQGFRGARAYDRAEPAGRLRVVCTGDSFTLGYGVSDQETWPSVLEKLDPRIETVNMGQGGYGVDQAFLWYRRDGLEFEHGLHLFAFIAGDFTRAQRERNFGCPKPVLRAVEGRLVVQNTPVPRLPYLSSLLAEKRVALSRLRVLELLRPTPRPGSEENERGALSLDELRAASHAMFAELARIHSERGSTCVVVHLPTKDMWKRAPGPDPIAILLRALAPELAALGLAYIDLAPPLRELTEAEAEALYIPAGELDFAAAAGHFSVAGNRWVAEQIQRGLLGVPAIAQRLSRQR